jgi:transposase InsO family protein
MLVGWRISTSLRTDLADDALDMACRPHPPLSDLTRAALVTPEVGR